MERENDQILIAQCLQKCTKQVRLWRGLLLAFIRNYILLITLSLLTHSSFSQLEYANWLWIDSNAISWTSGSAVDTHGIALTTSQNNKVGGSSVTISDRHGNLILASFGFRVYNGQGQLMQNNTTYPFFSGSIAGGECDNLLLCPKPCNDSIYYLFHSVGIGYLYKWRIFEINIHTNGGQGAVVGGPVVLDSIVTSAADLCRHGNNRDFWLISRGNDNQTFKSWLISDTGISQTPVISTVSGTNPNQAFWETLEISPNAKWIATSTRWNPISVLANTPQGLYQFDNQTGAVTHFCDLNDSNLTRPTHNFYTCFSPDNSKLYITSQQRALWQFDLSSGNASTIANSGVDIAAYSTDMPYGLRDMQIAPDGKIYIPRNGRVTSSQTYTTYMAVINNPNDTGSACNFVLDGFQCNQYSWNGLPNIIHSLFVPRIIQHDSIECTLDTTALYFDNYLYFDSATWYIDTGAAQVVVSSDSVAHHVFDSAGTYPIMAVTYSGCRLDTVYDTILVIPSPTPDLGPDTILCEGDTIAISNDWLYTYQWSTGDTTVGIEILMPDTYWLQLSNYCGVASDTVVIDSIIAALVHFPTDDTLLCAGDTLWLDAAVDAGTYEWHNASTNATFGAFESDTVWVQSSNACGISRDTINVRFTDIPVLPVLDSVLCNGDNYFINLTTDSLSMFVWYDGDSTAFDTIILQNTYWVEEWNVCGEDSTDFFVAFVNDPQTLLGNDTVLCISESLVLDATTPFGTYVWNTGDTSGAVTIDQTYLSADSMNFIVTVYNACKADTDNIIIKVDHPLVVDLGPDVVVCVGDTVVLGTDSTNRTLYQWNDGLIACSRDIVANFPLQGGGQGVGLFSLLATNSCGSTSDDITVFVDQPLAVDLGPDLNACFGDTITLSASITPDTARTTYLWQDALTADSRKLIASNFIATDYMLFVTNSCGTYQDSIHLSIDSLPANYFRDTVRFCRNQSTEVTIEKHDIDSLSWGDGSTSKTKIISSEALYFISFYNHCGRTRDTLIAKRQELPVIDITSPQNLCDQQLILELSYDSSLETYAYSWSDSSHHDYLPVTEPGNYSLTLTDAWGCKDSAEITVKTCGADWYAPNSFTPDGDGLNEFWKPVGEGIKSYEAIIFDRWGNAIFTFNQNDNGWDGTVKGTPIQPGVYGWLLNIETEDLPKGYSTMGQVVLVR